MPTTPARPPLLATYRLQFNKDFTFQDAAKIVDYLADLGITHVYASPILTARRGSGHGYDVTDPDSPQPRTRHRSRLPRLSRKVTRTRHGLDSRHRPEPYVGEQRKCLVDGCARKRPRVRLRFLLRYRLAPAVTHARRQSSSARAWAVPLAKRLSIRSSSSSCSKENFSFNISIRSSLSRLRPII